MATYSELYDLHDYEPLRQRVAVAVSVKAQNLVDLSTPTAAQVTWAEAALKNPLSETDKLFRYLLAKNNALTVDQIKNATDSSIQNQVDSAVDTIITGGA